MCECVCVRVCVCVCVCEGVFVSECACVCVRMKLKTKMYLVAGFEHHDVITRQHSNKCSISSMELYRGKMPQNQSLVLTRKKEGKSVHVIPFSTEIHLHDVTSLYSVHNLGYICLILIRPIGLRKYQVNIHHHQPNEHHSTRNQIRLSSSQRKKSQYPPGNHRASHL